MNLIAAPIISQLKFFTARINAADTLAFASMNAKHYYDRSHTFIFFKKGDSVYLRLYKGYNIPVNTVITHKLGRQYVGPFKIL